MQALLAGLLIQRGCFVIGALVAGAVLKGLLLVELLCPGLLWAHTNFSGFDSNSKKIGQTFFQQKKMSRSISPPVLIA